MNKGKQKAKRRARRHRHVRKNVDGRPERPRLCVFRSNKHIYAQVIDDWSQHTLVSCSSSCAEIKDEIGYGGNVASATKVGELIGKRCIEKGITAVVFDRGGYKYHGRVKALAEAARGQFKQAGAKGF